MKKKLLIVSLTAVLAALAGMGYILVQNRGQKVETANASFMALEDW